MTALRYQLLTGSVVLVALLAGCGGGDGPAAGPSPATTTATTPATDATPTPGPSEPVLADGRHPVYVTAVDMAQRRLTFDLIQFLTGGTAHDAYVKDHPDDPEGPPNDYYIVDDNPRLRTLPVEPGLEVIVYWLGSGGASTERIGFDELMDYFATNPAPEDGRLWFAPFWLTVQDGVVVAMDEQFIP